jgi:nucleoside-diphosphate-sugar epimerase
MHMGYGYGDWGGRVLTEEVAFAPRGRTRGLERHLAGFRVLEGQLFKATRGRMDRGRSLRFGALYGPDAGMQTLVDLLRRGRLPLVDGGRAVLSWIHHEDAATATVAALEHGRPGEAYNIVDDEPVAWRDFLGLLADMVGAPPPRSMPRWVVGLAAPYAAAFLSAALRASNARARRKLGWTPALSTYREGLLRVIQALHAGATGSRTSTTHGGMPSIHRVS